jgi:tRNA G10  N-methylase Trm11
MTNAMVFDAKAWEWNKDSLTIMEMQAVELQALCTCYNLKLAKTGKAAAAATIVNHLMVPRANVVTKHDVHNAIEVTMEQVAKNIMAPIMEAKIVTITGQVEKLQNKVDAMAKRFDTMQDSGEKWKEVVGRKVDKVANKVDRATDADLVKAREANIQVTGLTMSKGETSKQLMELVQTELLDRLKVADHVQVQKVHRQMSSGRLDKATYKAPLVIITLASVHDKLTVLRARKGLQCYGPVTNKWRITRHDKFY